MLNREQAVEIAKRHALNFAKSKFGFVERELAYLKGVVDPDWMPHEWVIAAIIEAGDRDYSVTEVAQAVKDSGIGFVAKDNSNAGNQT